MFLSIIVKVLIVTIFEEITTCTISWSSGMGGGTANSCLAMSVKNILLN